MSHPENLNKNKKNKGRVEMMKQPNDKRKKQLDLIHNWHDA